MSCIPDSGHPQGSVGLYLPLFSVFLQVAPTWIALPLGNVAKVTSPAAPSYIPCLRDPSGKRRLLLLRDFSRHPEVCSRGPMCSHKQLWAVGVLSAQRSNHRPVVGAGSLTGAGMAERGTGRPWCQWATTQTQDRGTNPRGRVTLVPHPPTCLGVPAAMNDHSRPALLGRLQRGSPLPPPCLHAATDMSGYLHTLSGTGGSHSQPGLSLEPQTYPPAPSAPALTYPGQISGNVGDAQPRPPAQSAPPAVSPFW